MIILTNIPKNQQHAKLKAVLSVALPFIAMVAVLCVYGIRYDTNDDATLANLSAGAYGSGLHTVHLNIILSAIMRPLYMLAGDVNWYIITQLIMSCLGIAAVFYCLSKKIGTKQGLVLAAALLVPFAGNFFYAFQYSKSSIIMLAGGLLLISENLKKFTPMTAAGIVLCLWGSMTRWESFFAAGGIYKYASWNYRYLQCSTSSFVLLGPLYVLRKHLSRGILSHGNIFLDFTGKKW